MSEKIDGFYCETCAKKYEEELMGKITAGSE
jgi:hypothetical protein